MRRMSLPDPPVIPDDDVPATGAPALLQRPSPRDRLKRRTESKTANYRVVPIIMNPALADAHTQAVEIRNLARIKADMRPGDEKGAVELIEAEEALAEIAEKVKPEIEQFLVVSMGRKGYDDLVNAHPPTKDQRVKAQKAGEDRPQFDSDTFPQALIAACLTWMGGADETAPPDMDPPQPLPTESLFTAAEIDAEMWNSPQWNSAETMALFLSCIEVNTGRRVVDLGKG